MAILSAPRFYLQPIGGGKVSWGFSQMSNISVEVEPKEFLYCESDGTLTHTKQYGKTVPPSVTLEKPMDTDTTLWAWHMAVQAGIPNARKSCTLVVYPAGSPGIRPEGAPVFQWELRDAWPQKIGVSGMSAGDTQVGTLTVTFACDLIQVLTANGGTVSPSP
jgi:phage tail-like protein